MIAILDFVFEENKTNDRFRHDVKLCYLRDGSVFYDKLTLVYPETPKFRKRLEDSASGFEEWLYVIRNLTRLDSLPKSLEERDVFRDLFKVAEVAAFTPEQRQSYEANLKAYRAYNNLLAAREAKGEKIGEARGIEKDEK